jgi:hypothetical protein
MRVCTCRVRDVRESKGSRKGNFELGAGIMLAVRKGGTRRDQIMLAVCKGGTRRDEIMLAVCKGGTRRDQIPNPYKCTRFSFNLAPNNITSPLRRHVSVTHLSANFARIPISDVFAGGCTSLQRPGCRVFESLLKERNAPFSFV